MSPSSFPLEVLSSSSAKFLHSYFRNTCDVTCRVRKFIASVYLSAIIQPTSFHVDGTRSVKFAEKIGALTWVSITLFALPRYLIVSNLSVFELWGNILIFVSLRKNINIFCSNTFKYFFFYVYIYAGYYTHTITPNVSSIVILKWLLYVLHDISQLVKVI